MSWHCFFCYFYGRYLCRSPLCSCYDNEDDTITCEGGFLGGSFAVGVEILVVGASGKVLIKGKMDENSEFIFQKPGSPYKVRFDQVPGHEVVRTFLEFMLIKFRKEKKIDKFI